MLLNEISTFSQEKYEELDKKIKNYHYSFLDKIKHMHKKMNLSENQEEIIKEIKEFLKIVFDINRNCLKNTQAKVFNLYNDLISNGIHEYNKSNIIT